MFTRRGGFHTGVAPARASPQWSGSIGRVRHPMVGRIETRVVHGDQWARIDVLAQIQAQSLEQLQTARAHPMGMGDGIGLQL